MLNIVIFGPPGCGKGTQSTRISSKYNLVHLSTGEIIRKEINSESKTGKTLKSIVEKGELVPYHLIISILESALKQNRDADGYIFDGFPRTIKQAIDLDKIMAKDNKDISMVLSLSVEDEEVVERLLHRAKTEGRKDDTKDVIKNRLKVYKEQTLPLKEWYKKQGKLIEVEGDCNIDNIFNHICEIIEEKEEVA